MGRDILKIKPVVFILIFYFTLTVDARNKKKMENWGYFHQRENYGYLMVRLSILNSLRGIKKGSGRVLQNRTKPINLYRWFLKIFGEHSIRIFVLSLS